uniref:Uncharacterized protein n=1 Tax=Rhizophora mucronata TaxID=61149 RepID=A0A2P2P4X1_RHIMU
MDILQLRTEEKKLFLKAIISKC